MTQRNLAVFVVDENDAVRNSLQAMLDAAGYATEGYGSGAALLAVIEDRGAGCVLLDTLMPGMSGLDVLQALRAERPDLPVLMIAGGNGAFRPDEAIEAGAIDYLEKPFLEDTLLQALGKAFALIDAGDDKNSLAQETAYAGRKLERLTGKERALFDLLVVGRDEAFINSSLGLRRIDLFELCDTLFEKMEARGLTQLRRMAFLTGIPLCMAPTPGYL